MAGFPSLLQQQMHFIAFQSDFIPLQFCRISDAVFQLPVYGLKLRVETVHGFPERNIVSQNRISQHQVNCPVHGGPSEQLIHAHPEKIRNSRQQGYVRRAVSNLPFGYGLGYQKQIFRKLCLGNVFGFSKGGYFFSNCQAHHPYPPFYPNYTIVGCGMEQVLKEIYGHFSSYFYANGGRKQGMDVV